MARPGRKLIPYETAFSRHLQAHPDNPDMSLSAIARSCRALGHPVTIGFLSRVASGSSQPGLQCALILSELTGLTIENFCKPKHPTTAAPA